MDSIDLSKLEHAARRRYELRRVSTGVLGFAPVLVLVGLASLLGRRPLSALLFGAVLFAAGVLVLWRGEAPRRGVLPGVISGLFPMAMALGFNFAHGCNGDHCTMVCLPACSAGGLGAGLMASTYLVRHRLPWPAWGTAAALSLLTGGMGCICVGYTGVLVMTAGFALGLALTVLSRPGAAA
jgi:hypothetical protein